MTNDKNGERRPIEEVQDGYQKVSAAVARLWQEKGWARYGYVLMMIDHDHLVENSGHPELIAPAMSSNMSKEAATGFMMKMAKDVLEDHMVMGGLAVDPD